MRHFFRGLTFKIIGMVVATTIVMSMCTLGAFATDYVGIGTITGSVVNIRSEANTTSQVVAQATAGNTYHVLLEQYGWVKIEYNGGSRGWISGDYISVAPISSSNSRGVVTGTAVNVRSGPSTGYGVIGLVYYGQTLPIKGQENGWVKVDYQGVDGWVSGEFISSDRDNNSSRSADRGPGQQIVDEAMKHVGKAYVYGAAGPNSFDCSGFTSYVFAKFGYKLNRTAAGQNSNGVAVSKADLQPGDIITFQSRGYSGVGHVGIYIGNGKMVHAGNSSTGVTVTDINSSYYGPRFVSGRRIAR